MNVPIVVYVLLGVLVVYLVVRVVKYVGLDKLREVAYQGFLLAEKEFNQGDNQEKFEYVVDLVRSAVPIYLKPFITEKLLRNIIQMWFNLCKDLLNYTKEKGEK